MSILLTGVGYNNKGAELMLRAMVEHFRFSFSGTRLVCGFSAAYEDRVREGLYQLIDRSRGRAANLFQWLPEKTRSEWGFTLSREINVIVDASGFAFGDQWSDQYVDAGISSRIKHQKHGAPLILMPQAFGPFTRMNVRRAATELFSHADLIFPRDRESYAYVTELIPKSDIAEKVHQAPDFTNIVQGFIPQSFDDNLRGAVGILPNQKMITKNGEEEAEKYIDFLVHVLSRLKSRKISHFILCHQKEDHEVVDLLRAKGEKMPPIIAESNALFIKGILGTCRFLIGSRFHGLINGLSQGIPCICTSWSHKYKFLFEDYDCLEYLVSELRDFDRIDGLIESLLTESTYRPLCRNIEACSMKLKDESRKTWQIVDAFIRKTI